MHEFVFARTFQLQSIRLLFKQTRTPGCGCCKCIVQGRKCHALAVYFQNKEINTRRPPSAPFFSLNSFAGYFVSRVGRCVAGIRSISGFIGFSTDRVKLTRLSDVWSMRQRQEIAIVSVATVLRVGRRSTAPVVRLGRSSSAAK
jgi:hypothetical protein